MSIVLFAIENEENPTDKSFTNEEYDDDKEEESKSLFKDGWFYLGCVLGVLLLFIGYNICIIKVETNNIDKKLAEVETTKKQGVVDLTNGKKEEEKKESLETKAEEVKNPQSEIKTDKNADSGGGGG